MTYELIPAHESYIKLIESVLVSLQNISQTNISFQILFNTCITLSPNKEKKPLN